MFCIDVELLTGRYVATSANDRRVAEWPPHPARFFSALVAALHDRDPEEPTEREALQWLEAQSPPALDADLAPLEGVGRRNVLDVYVPVNDVSLFADLEQEVREAQRDLDRLATAPPTKESKADLKKATRALENARKKLAQEIASTPDKPTRSEETAVEIAQGRPLRQVRTFPSVRPERSVLSYIWTAEISPPHRSALDRLCERVTRLGHSSSLVRCLVTDGPRCATLVPDDRGRVVLRTVMPGQLERLEREYERHREIEVRILPALPRRYGVVRRIEQGPEMRGGVFSTDWIMYERVGGARILSSRGPELARALRAALLEQRGTMDLPATLCGHGVGGTASDITHIAFAALPWIGHEHADASVQGCAIILPHDLPPRDREVLFSLLAAWERDRAIDEDGTMELAASSLPVVHLRRVELPSKTTLRAPTWCRPSRVFVTATPVALDRYPGNLRSNIDAAARKAAAEAARSIAESCERTGLPTPASVEISLAPLISGAQPVRSFLSWPLRRGRPPRVRVHARITFHQEIRGPVLLGAGRYFGLGLCMPVYAGDMS